MPPGGTEYDDLPASEPVSEIITPHTSTVQPELTLDRQDLSRSEQNGTHGRGQRQRLPIRRYQDYIAHATTGGGQFIVSNNPAPTGNNNGGSGPTIEPTGPQPDTESPLNSDTGHSNLDPVLSTSSVLVTGLDEFGLCKAFTQQLNLDPESNAPLETLGDTNLNEAAIPETKYANDSDTELKDDDDPPSEPDTTDPLKSRSMRTILRHYIHSNLNSQEGLNRFMNDLIDGKIDLESVKKVAGRRWDTKRLLNRIDKMQKLDPSNGVPSGWREITLEIRLPKEGKDSGDSEEDAPKFQIKGVFVRNLVNVIKAMFRSPQFLKTHILPHKRFFNRRDRKAASEEQAKLNPTSKLSDTQVPGSDRIYGELYESDTWIKLQEQLDALPPSAKPRVIAALQLYSDATLVAAFGGKSAWPIYVQFGGHSKYKRAHPSISITQQIAFIPKLPDELQDAYRKHYGRAASVDVLGHCKREMVHQLWTHILDEEFVEGYKNGIAIKCYDGIERLVFPRIFTYAADYPEK